MSAAKTGFIPAVNGPFRRLVQKMGLVTAALLIAVLGLTFAPASSPASAAAPEEGKTITQCDSVDNQGGQGRICDVTVNNNRNLITGAVSSTVVVQVCTGAANTDLTCTTTPTGYPTLTTKVDQCNGALNGGGSSVVCTVNVVNTVTSAVPLSFPTATVNQCDGSGLGGGTGPTLDCLPFPATVTNAAITQCNGTANGGGAEDRVTCTVTDASTTSAEVPVTINQCNGTANGGGSVVECTASLTNISRVAAVASSTPTPTATATAAPQNQAAATPTPSATAAPVGKNTLHDSQTDGFTPAPAEGSNSVVALGIGGLLMAALLIGAMRARRVSARL